MMYPAGWIGAALNGGPEQYGPFGADWLFELCRRYRVEGLPFHEAMAKAKTVTGFVSPRRAA